MRRKRNFEASEMDKTAKKKGKRRKKEKEMEKGKK